MLKILGRGWKNLFLHFRHPFDTKNLGNKKPNEIIRISIDALEPILYWKKILGAVDFGKGVENWKLIFDKKIFQKF